MAIENNKNLTYQELIETPQLKALKITLDKFEIPSIYYSLAGYREDAVCIEQISNDVWSVYEAERGNKHNLATYNQLVEACSELIARISESDEEEKQMHISFTTHLNVIYAESLMAVANEERKSAIDTTFRKYKHSEITHVIPPSNTSLLGTKQRKKARLIRNRGAIAAKLKTEYSKAEKLRRLEKSIQVKELTQGNYIVSKSPSNSSDNKELSKNHAALASLKDN